MSVRGLIESPLIVFDLDGTLIDSRLEIALATNQTRLEFGLFEATKADLDLWFGKHPRNFFPELAREAQDAAAIAFRNKLFESKTETILFPDSVPSVLALKSIGCKIGVATTKSTALAIKTLQNTQLITLIDAIQGSDGIPEKPSPDVFLHLEKKILTKSKKNANFQIKVSVGDRVSDITAGNAAGYNSYGIRRETNSDSEESLIKAGAFAVLTSLMELLKIVELEARK